MGWLEKAVKDFNKPKPSNYRHWLPPMTPAMFKKLKSKSKGKS